MSNSNKHSKLYFSVDQAAAGLGCSTAEVESRIASGQLLQIDVGDTTLITVRPVDKSSASGGPFAAATPVDRGPALKSEFQTPSSPSPRQDSQEPGDLSLPDNDQGYYSPRQAAEILGIDLFEVNRLIRRGELSAVSRNKYRWIVASDVVALARSTPGLGSVDHMPKPTSLPDVETQAARPQPAKVETPRTPETNDPPMQGEAVSSSESTQDYYTLDQAVAKLRKSSSELWRMVAFGRVETKSIDGQRVFSKQSIDAMSGGAPASDPTTDDHYTVEEAADHLGVDPDDIWEMVYRGNLTVVRTKKQSYFPKDAVDALLEDARPSVEATPPQVRVQTEAVTPDEDFREDAGETGTYYTPQQAAELLSTSTTEVEELIRQGKLPTVNVEGYPWLPASKVIPAESVESLMSKNKLRKLRRGRVKRAPKPYRIYARGVQVPTEEPSQREPTSHSTAQADPPETSQLQPDSPQNVSPTQTDRVADHRRVEFIVLEAAQRLNTSTDSVRHMLATGELRLDRRRGQLVEADRSSVHPNVEDNVPEPSEKPISAVHKGPYEAPESSLRASADADLELELLKEKLRAEEEEREYLADKLEQERAERRHDHLEAQREINQLEAELENLRRDRAGNSQPTAAADLHRQLAQMSTRLKEDQTRIEELENALANEKTRRRELETEKRMLDEIRHLVGSMPKQPLTQSREGFNGEPQGEPTEGPEVGTLLLRTPYGQYAFDLPFPLDDQEIELVRLVAREDEITADQLRRLKGRRAIERLNDLLDRLADEGIVLIEEVNDRYSFDPNNLRND